MIDRITEQKYKEMKRTYHSLIEANVKLMNNKKELERVAESAIDYLDKVEYYKEYIHKDILDLEELRKILEVYKLWK